jgi:glutaminyl-peptide cyclotransferase
MKWSKVAIAGVLCCIGLLAVFGASGVLRARSSASDGATRVSVPLAFAVAPGEGCVPARVPGSTLPVYGYRVAATYPHDRDAFTQGLVYEDDVLYEGTGLNGRSDIRRVELETGTVLQERDLEAQYFGEGITVLGDKLYQLTWQSQVGFVYDKTSFEVLREFQYPTEGWGLADDGARLMMSDGTARIRFLDPETLQETGFIDVHDGATPITQLNELEYIQGSLYANIWQTDRIAEISPDTGEVTAWLDLTGLLPVADRTPPVDVLNGIAYDAGRDRFFVTGKLWPRLFEIDLIRPCGT